MTTTQKVAAVQLSVPGMTATTKQPDIVRASAEPFLETALGIKGGGEQLVFKDWKPPRIEFKAGNGTLLGTVYNFNLGFFRVNDTNGQRVCFETLLHQMDPSGWTNQTAKYQVHVFSKAGGLLDVWDLGYVPVLCGAAPGSYTTLRQNFNPDYFDLIGSAQLVFGTGQFFHC